MAHSNCEPNVVVCIAVWLQHTRALDQSSLSLRRLSSISNQLLPRQQPGPPSAAAHPPRVVVEDDVEDEISKMERKENILGRLIEYGVSQLSSMRASMAKTIWRSIKARLPWRATPSRSPYDYTDEGYGVHSFERIANYALYGYTPFLMKKGVVDPWYPKDKWATPQKRS